jgi:geranylgeranylglycerol-phosphate geranylgeranyltransferase
MVVGRLGVRAVLASLARLTRAGTCLAAATLCFVGDRVSRAPDGGGRMLAATASIAFIVAFAQVVNDIADRDADRLTKPHRPLPSGAVSLTTARAVAVTSAAAGILTAALGGPWQVLFAIVLLTLSWAYSWFLKSTVLLGNLTVASLASTAVLYGAVGGGITSLALLVQAVVLTFSAAFEVVKTARDREGDAAAGVTTVATRFGVHAASRIGSGLALLAAAVAATPALPAVHPVRYLVAMGVTAIVPTLAAAVALGVCGRVPEDLEAPFRLLRFAWSAGVVCLVLLP